MGYVAWIGKYETEDSVLVTLLHNAGAVFYVKTSVPQSLMVCETVNNVIGRTVNPRNKNWSCGGSSGGEGAMVGFRGGIIGVGTDIGKFSTTPQIIKFVTDISRWVYSSPFSIQLSLWIKAKSWKTALWKDGE
jgi:amidase